MANMSYCRFRNTLADLRDCYDNWDGPDDDENADEIKARKRLIQVCKMIVDGYGDDIE